ncbi:alpha/beta hydrolase [Streptomyces sp. enrichment culture]|uniref:alpha/beta hydrolase n=1 Tax=Streptomyces sp. enrichment culture TaxID=1795815 RepID=UPI003F543731
MGAGVESLDGTGETVGAETGETGLVTGGARGRAQAGSGPSLPFVLFFHDGGFVLCGLDSHDGLCRLPTAGTGAVVVSVDYRPAPEHPAPAAVRDACAAFDRAVRHGASLGRPARRSGTRWAADGGAWGPGKERLEDACDLREQAASRPAGSDGAAGRSRACRRRSRPR